ncbi:MAG TPA: hypothetical protein VJJ79_02640 [Candidatus Nanoarchaeia archaeon]|nr:hypothetical protein [Candidatus Nanoarchaeia archaeon]
MGTYDEIETECSNCKLSFKVKDMKVSPETNRLICVNCFTFPGSKIKRIR